MTPSVATTSTHHAMSPSSLNKLQAQVLCVKLMNAPNAEKLEEEYEAEVRRTKGEEGGVRTRVEVLPALNVTGQMYDQILLAAKILHQMELHIALRKARSA